MADGITMKITGVKQTRKNLRRFERIAIAELKDGIERSLILMENKAKKIAPFQFGGLARSITHAITNVNNKIIRGVLGANKEYAVFLELGDKKHASKKGFIGKPTKFLFPAVQANFKRAVNEIKKSMKRAMRLAAR